MRERLGVYGGTFDPIHVAHIVAAVETRAVVGLDRLLMVVAGDPWQKRDQVIASADDRFAMVAAAVESIDGIEASAIEIEQGEPSVTADTLEALAAPQRDLFVVLGADAVRNMPSWRRLEETRDLAAIVVVSRDGESDVAPPGEGWRVERVRIPRLDVSSTDIRARLGEGRPVDGLVPAGTVRVIRDRKLYT